MTKIIVYTVIALIVIVAGNIFFPVPQAAIEVAPEAIGLGPDLTNSVITSFIISIFLIIAAVFIGQSLKEKPGGVQNVVEMLIEGLDNLISSIAPKKWAPTFFPILATIFIYLLFANWTSLLTPFFGSFGVVHPAEHGGIGLEEVTFVVGGPEDVHFDDGHNEGAEGEAEGEGGEGDHDETTAAGEQEVIIVPLFRAPSSDLNLTFALAIISVVLTQVFGLWERGLGYIGHFIRLDGFKKGFGLGLIDLFVGLLEAVSEVAKIISFSFRLFGNIFAGEVVLIVISSLVTFLVLLVFFGLEIFVGVIQAFVFFILSLVFFAIATQQHGEEH